MEIILRQGVENLGKPGDVVKVKPGYARNYLLPHGLAYEATPGNLKRIQQERDRLEAAENERRGAAQGLRRKGRAGVTDLLGARGRRGQAIRLGHGVPTSPRSSRRRAFHVEKRQIDLHEPIKALGVYRVPIRLHADVKPEVRVWVIKQ